MPDARPPLPPAPRLSDDWDGRRVTVCGLGLFGGGAAVARALAARGARVTATDLRGPQVLAPALDELAADLGAGRVRLALGGHREEDFARADAVVANPAVPPASPFLALARAAGVPVTSESALFLASTRARLALVTGTQGKSSVTQAAADLALAAGLAARAGGNIGRPLIEAAEALGAQEVVVLELSSYQLEALPPRGSFAREGEAGPRVEAVAITNVLADHLERHGTVEAYLAAKLRVLELARPGAWAVVPASDARLAGAVPPGLVRVERFDEDGGRGLRVDGAGRFRLEDEVLGHVDELRLPGRFQRENALVALALARRLGASPAALAAALPTLVALPHRLEELGLHAGRRVIDNGVSTTPDSTLAVLDSLPAGATLVCGGRAKSLPLEPLARAARGRLARVVAFGESREALRAAFAAEGLEAHAREGLEEALALAFEAAGPGGTLVFSPACASFDAYANFRARAEAFRTCLARLAREDKTPPAARG